MQTVLVTGASRGIGLEFVRQYAARGAQVIATCRGPADAQRLQDIAAAQPHVAIAALDVTDVGACETLAASLQGRAIDLLINNAGIGGSSIGLGSMDLSHWRRVHDTNVLGPAKLIDALLPNLAAGQAAKVVNISSTLGSIARTTGGNYAYRASKAALNMVMRSMAFDLKPKGIAVVLMSPGIVDTDFTRGGRMPKIPVQDSVAGMITVIDRLNLDNTGQFLRYSGETVEW